MFSDACLQISVLACGQLLGLLGPTDISSSCEAPNLATLSAVNQIALGVCVCVCVYICGESRCIAVGAEVEVLVLVLWQTTHAASKSLRFPCA